MIIQIKRIIQEGYSYGDLLENLNANQVRETFNNRGNVAERIAAPASAIPLVGGIPSGISQAIGGYQVGSKIGHPIAGAVLGRDGAVGAASKNVKGLSVKDVYTPKNILNKSLLAAGAIGGLYAGDELTDAMSRSIYNDVSPEVQKDFEYLKDYDHKFMGNDTVGNMQKIIAGSALLTPAILPGLRYGAGKVFGKKY